MEEQLEVMGARRWAGNSLAALHLILLGEKLNKPTICSKLKSRRRARKRSQADKACVRKACVRIARVRVSQQN